MDNIIDKRLTEVILVPPVPITLSVIIGDIVLRFGELERALITAHARLFHPDNMYEALGSNREQSTMLGNLIARLKKDFEPYKLNWINFDDLERLKNMRDAIVHDSLVQQQDGSYTWQSNSNSKKARKHRPVDYAELFLLREAVERTIAEIMTGSKMDKDRFSCSPVIPRV